MLILGYFLAIVIGVILGLIGGGGSILTVPVLVYIFGVAPVVATAYSLFVVGLTSAFGASLYHKRGMVDWQMTLIFGAPSVLAVFLTRAYVIPWIPEKIATIGSFELTRDIFLMSLFALLMVLASYSMIRKQRKSGPGLDTKFNYFLVISEGLIVGLFTGLVGAGGGFLIIPALVVLGKMPMKTAVGTSLAIIAAKSLIGFLGESSETAIDWSFLLLFSAFALGGILAGLKLQKYIDGAKLKPGFGFFILVMGILILIKEIFL